jgi:hypothetical protein
MNFILAAKKYQGLYTTRLAINSCAFLCRSGGPGMLHQQWKAQHE